MQKNWKRDEVIEKAAYMTNTQVDKQQAEM